MPGVETAPDGAGRDRAALASRFTARQWREERREVAAEIDVRVAPAAIEAVSAIAPALAAVVATCARALGLPSSTPRVVRDPTLHENEFEVAVAGLARYVASLTPEEAVGRRWNETPVGGIGGRTGIAPRFPANGGLEIGEVVRALEEVLWRDPGLLATREGMARLLDATSLAWYTPDRDSLTSAWTPVLRGLASVRVPLDRDAGNGALLESALAAAGATATIATPCERLAYRLRPYEIRVWLGSALYDTIGPERETSRFRDELMPQLRRDLFEELGVAYPPLRVERSDELGPDAYWIVVNSLPRANGEIPAGKLAVGGPPHELPGVAAEPWFSPLTGRLGSWVAAEDVPRLVGYETFDADHVLVQQVSACLRESASEFADLPWTQQQLHRLGNDFPDLVAAVLEEHTYEELTKAFSDLVDERVAIRHLPPILERIAEAAPGEHGGDLAEHVRRGMHSWLCQRFAHRIEWEGEELRRVRSVLFTLRLDRELEAALRAELRGSAPADGDSARRTLLRGLRLALRSARSRLAFEYVFLPPVLVTPSDLRLPVLEAVAAQFPLVPVLALDEVEGEADEHVLGLVQPTA